MEHDANKRIFKAVNLIMENPVKNHTLETLAAVSCYSTYHFLRMFTLVTGVSPGQYLRRERIKRSLNQILHHSQKSITEIAHDSGFSSSANFSKAFKHVMGINPRQSRKFSYEELVKRAGSGETIQVNFTDDKWLKLLKQASLKTVEERDLLYLRYTGPYNWKIGLSWLQFMTILRKNNLLSEQSQLTGIVRDNPDLNNPETTIYDIAVSGSEWTSIPAPLMSYHLPAQTYAVFPFSGTSHELHTFFAYIYGIWFENGPHTPGEGPILQHFHQTPRNQILTFDLYIPVESPS